MIRITIEMIPHGDESRARKMYTMEIENDGTGNQYTGNYLGTLHAEYTGSSPRKGRVANFNRKTQSVWSLIGAFLKLFGHTKHSPSHMQKIN